jgi:hypothetical protein
VSGSGLYQPPITGHPLFQGGGGLARGSEQCLDESPGLGGVKLNLIVLIDDLASRFTKVRNDEFGHRKPLNCGRLLEQLFVRRRHPGDKALAFLLFCHRRYKPNVCRHGTHDKR